MKRIIGGALIDRIRLIQQKDELSEDDLVAPVQEQYDEAVSLIKLLVEKGNEDGDMDFIDMSDNLKILLEDDDTTSFDLSKYIQMAKKLLGSGDTIQRSYGEDEYDSPDDFTPMEGRGFITSALTRNERGIILSDGDSLHGGGRPYTEQEWKKKLCEGDDSLLQRKIDKIKERKDKKKKEEERQRRLDAEYTKAKKKQEEGSLSGGVFDRIKYKPIIIHFLRQIAGGEQITGVDRNFKDYTYFRPRYDDARLGRIADTIIADYPLTYNEWGDHWVTRQNVEKLYRRYEVDK